jgi:predicted metal-binding protein
MAKRDLTALCTFARKHGALHAKVIEPTSVIASPWVRLKCQFGCDGYGECLTCPPYSPPPEQTRSVLDSYQHGILVHSGDHVDISRLAYQVERTAFLSGFYKAFGLGSGPCRLCRRCDVTQQCKYGMEARPSMEAAGIDVFQTVRDNGFSIEVLTSHQCRANYFGLVLVD